jgi:hypothetical protein
MNVKGVDLRLHPFLTLAPNGGEEAGWATGSVWTFWRREKSLISAGIRIPGREARGLVTAQSASGCYYHILSYSLGSLL